MKKNILVIICIFLLTGCNITYNLEIDENKLTESTNFYFSESDFNFESYIQDVEIKHFSSIDDFVDSVIDEDYKAFDGNFSNELYAKKILNNETGKGMNLKYVYNYDNYGKSNLLSYCGENIKYDNGENISIDINDLSSCFMTDYGPWVDKISIKIKTNLKVSENNADKVKDNIYTWVARHDNYYNKSLKIVMQKNNRSEEKTFLNVGNMMIFVIFLLFIVFLGFIIYIFVRKKHISNNSI